MKKLIVSLSAVSTMLGFYLPLSASAQATKCAAGYQCKDVQSEIIALGRKYEEVYLKIRDKADTLTKAQIEVSVKELGVVTEAYLAAAEIPYGTNLVQIYNIKGKDGVRVDLTYKIYIPSGSAGGDAFAQLMFEAAFKPQFPEGHLIFSIDPLQELKVRGEELNFHSRLDYHTVSVSPGAIAREALGAGTAARMGIEHALRYSQIRQGENTLARVEIELETNKRVRASSIEAYLQSLQFRLTPERAAAFQRIIAGGGVSAAVLEREWKNGLLQDFAQIEALIAQIRSASHAVESKLLADPTGSYLNTQYYAKTLTATHHIPSASGKMIFDLTEVLDPKDTMDRAAARRVVLAIFQWNKQRLEQIEKEVANLKLKAGIQ